MPIQFHCCRGRLFAKTKNVESMDKIGGRLVGVRDRQVGRLVGCPPEWRWSLHFAGFVISQSVVSD